MDEGEAIRIARGAVQDAMKEHGDNNERAFQELQEMAEKDPQLNHALAMVGFMAVQADQAFKH